jgi:hypothetical protein
MPRSVSERVIAVTIQVILGQAGSQANQIGLLTTISTFAFIGVIRGLKMG